MQRVQHTAIAHDRKGLVPTKVFISPGLAKSCSAHSRIVARTSRRRGTGGDAGSISPFGSGAGQGDAGFTHWPQRTTSVLSCFDLMSSRLVPFGQEAAASKPTAAVDRALPVPSVGRCRHKIGVRCGSIRVPLYWSRPEMGSLTVRFKIFEHADDATPSLEPVVAFEGGPGYGSIGSAPSYLFMLGSLHRHHDLILMDQRGTGSSGAISCPELQRGIGNYVDAVAACARRLGPAANAYGSAAVADDLHAILRGLGVSKVDVYGDSYGTYAAQTFALHHPQDVRSVVLDGAFDQSFDPFERESSASLREAWSALCKRSGTCEGILSSIARFERRLRARPLTGIGFDADGYRYNVHLTAIGFASLVEDATYAYTFFRDLPAALASVDHGDAAPMLRLAAEDASFNASGRQPAGLFGG